MADVFNGWSTNFIYQQDLTSYYMNNALRSVIKPGIYNANMAIYSVGNSSDGALYLTIKKGTTFVFSNDYEVPYDSTFGIRRSIRPSSSKFVGLSNNNRMALIKSVALRDISVKIYKYGSLPSNGKIYSLHAYMKYNPLTEGGTNAQSAPLFFLSYENNTSSTEVYSKALYKPEGSLWGSKTDGDSITEYSIELGAVPDGLDINPLDGETANGPVLNEYFLQVGFLVPKKANTEGMADFVFTGRGLPEYRHSFGDDSEVLTPDVIPNANGKFDKVFFDIPLSYTGTAVLEHRIVENSLTPDNDWETAYLTKRIPSTDTRDNVSITADGKTEVIYACVSNIRSYSTPEIHEYTEIQEEGNIADTFDISFHSVEVEGLTLSSSTIDKTPWAASDKMDSVGSVLPLDICRINQERLLRGIAGKDIVSSLIDYIRMTPSYDPNYITDIIPIAIVFKKTGEGLDPTNMISYFDLRNKMSQINSLDVVEHNIFNLIPIMN